MSSASYTILRFQTSKDWTVIYQMIIHSDASTLWQGIWNVCKNFWVLLTLSKDNMTSGIPKIHHCHDWPSCAYLMSYDSAIRFNSIFFIKVIHKPNILCNWMKRIWVIIQTTTWVMDGWTANYRWMDRWIIWSCGMYTGFTLSIGWTGWIQYTPHNFIIGV